ncbi:MAG: hypothetical protein AAGH57_07560 [Pseudomonadota bacterium]
MSVHFAPERHLALAVLIAPTRNGAAAGAIIDQDISFGSFGQEARKHKPHGERPYVEVQVVLCLQQRGYTISVVFRDKRQFWELRIEIGQDIVALDDDFPIVHQGGHEAARIDAHVKGLEVLFAREIKVVRGPLNAFQ